MCLGLASGYSEPKEKITPEKALEWVNDFIKDIKEEQAIVNNGDEWHIEALKVFEVIKQLFQDNKRLHSDVKSLENELIVLKNQNSILSRNADSAFQDGLNEARDLYKAEVQDEIKTEAVEELFTKVNEIQTEIYNKHIFGDNDLDDVEKDAIINFSDDVTYALDKLKKEYAPDINVGTKEEMTPEKALEGKVHSCCKKFEDYPITIGIQKGNTGYRVAYEFLWDDGNYYGDYVDIGESFNANKVADAVRLLYNQAEGLFEALNERKIEK